MFNYLSHYHLIKIEIDIWLKSTQFADKKPLTLLISLCVINLAYCTKKCLRGLVQKHEKSKIANFLTL